MTAIASDRPIQPATEVGARTVVSIDHISRRFTTKRHDILALDDIQLEIAEGEFLCIVGPSGCGKTTLLNIVAGFIPSDGGEVRVGGRVVHGPGADRVVVFQEAALFPWLNVLSNVEFGLKIAGVSRQERRERAEAAVRLVGLGRFARAYVHELSGGMKQRVQLARSLAVRPRILLMDEPFAALDAQTRHIMQDELQALWQQTGATILFVTHNVREAVLLADRIVIMSPSPGRISEELRVSLPHPRDPDSHQVGDLAAYIREKLRDLAAAETGDSMAPSALRLGRIVVFYVALLCLWQLLAISGLWEAYIFPSPVDVYHALAGVVSDGELAHAVRTTMERMAIGYSLSIVAGVTIGVAMASRRVIDDTLGSLVLGLQSLPSITWFPLALLWFGLSERAIIFVVLMGSVCSVAISARGGVQAIPPLLTRAARMFGAGRFQMYQMVVLPGILPAMVQGLRLGWSFAWRSLLAAELLYVSVSLGHLLGVGRDFNDVSLVVAIMLVIVAIGLLMDRLVFGQLEGWVNRRWGM